MVTSSVLAARLHPTGVFSNVLMQKKRHHRSKSDMPTTMFTMKVNEMKVNCWTNGMSDEI